MDGVVPFDVDELDPDEPLSSDVGHSVLAALLALRGRLQSYLCWSGLENSDHPNAIDHMADYTHRIWVPVHPGTLREDLKLTVHARASNPTGDPAGVRIHHGGSQIRLPESTGWSLAAGAPASWQISGVEIPNTVRMTEGAALPDLPHPFGQLAINPSGNVGFGFDLSSQAHLHSISIWGI